MKITREFAENIAKNFISKMNPTWWNGEGYPPEQFNSCICTYDFGSPWVELDISFDYVQNECGDLEWEHYCEIVDKDNAELCVPLHGYGINSYLNLADTILDICNSYDWFEEEDLK